MSFPVSVSVQLRPLVSGIGRQNGIGLTLFLRVTWVSWWWFLQFFKAVFGICWPWNAVFYRPGAIFYV